MRALLSKQGRENENHPSNARAGQQVDHGRQNHNHPQENPIVSLKTTHRSRGLLGSFPVRRSRKVGLVGGNRFESSRIFLRISRYFILQLITRIPLSQRADRLGATVPGAAGSSAGRNGTHPRSIDQDVPATVTVRRPSQSTPSGSPGRSGRRADQCDVRGGPGQAGSHFYSRKSVCVDNPAVPPEHIVLRARARGGYCSKML